MQAYKKSLRSLEVNHEDDHESDTGLKVPSLYSETRNETMTTCTDSFSYSENSQCERSTSEKRPHGSVAPPLKDISTTPRAGTRKSSPHVNYRSNALSIASSSSDSWDSISESNLGNASREVSLLDTADSRDDAESESDGDEGRDGIDKMYNITLDYHQANNHLDESISPSFAGSSLSLPKLANGPYSHLRNSNSNGTEWMKSFMRKEELKAAAESCVTEQQFLQSAEQREKQKKLSENNRPDMRQNSFLLTSLKNILSPLTCGPRPGNLKYAVEE